MLSDPPQQRLLDAIVAAAAATAREVAALAGLDDRALSHSMLVAGNVLCLLAQSKLEAAGVDADEMDSTIEAAVEMGVAYTLQLEQGLPR